MSLRYAPGQAPVVVTPLGFVVLDPGLRRRSLPASAASSLTAAASAASSKR